MRKERSFTAPGLIPLVTALLILLLVSFSLLSLSTARSDLARTEALARRQQAWYTACNTAEAARSALIRGLEPELEVVREDGLLRYSVEMEGGQLLRVTLEAETFRILQWQLTQP